MKKSTVHSSFSFDQLGKLKLDKSEPISQRDIANLKAIGFDFDQDYIEGRQAAYIHANRNAAGFDAKNFMSSGFDSELAPSVTTASIGNPVQFYQAWMPGMVNIMKAPRKIDDLLGVQTIGDWADESVVQAVLERSGNAGAYSDGNNENLADWNVNFETRSVFRGEIGVQVGRLEQERAAKIRVSDGDEKRFAAIQALEIQRNDIGFYGYNDGANATYGMFNDPGLAAYGTPVADGGNTEWALISYLGIVNQLIQFFAQLQNQSNGLVDPKSQPTVLAIPVSQDQYLSKTSTNGAQGYSVRQWLRDNYPMCRVVTAPEFDGADGGANVAFLYADTVGNSGSDDQRTWAHMCPARLKTLGVQQLTKGYREDFSNATAGVMLKRPYANTAWSGI